MAEPTPLSASVYESVVVDGKKDSKEKVAMYSIQCATIDCHKMLHWWTVQKR